MNTYLYAPKDDYKHRLDWRELYTEEQAGMYLCVEFCFFCSAFCSRLFSCLCYVDDGGKYNITEDLFGWFPGGYEMMCQGITGFKLT